jgi:hypothetical protein
MFSRLWVSRGQRKVFRVNDQAAAMPLTNERVTPAVPVRGRQGVTIAKDFRSVKEDDLGNSALCGKKARMASAEFPRSAKFPR